jgi:hypothetical protein
LTPEEREFIGQMQPRQYDGYNLLHMSVDCIATDSEIICIIIEEFGVDVKAVTLSDGYNVIDLCEENDRSDLVDLLRSYFEELHTKKKAKV